MRLKQIVGFRAGTKSAILSCSKSFKYPFSARWTAAPESVLTSGAKD